jgi:nicotinate-nucleotide adenylyltransferase
MAVTNPQRIGVFGGTFDPVHLGHLVVAEQCREQGRLDEVWFVPAFQSPFKLDRHVAPFAQRVEMLALAIAGQPAFRIEQVEKGRPGPSYTSDTLHELHQRHPDRDLFFVVGSDVLPSFPQWHEPVRIVELATLLIVARPQWPLMKADELHGALHLPASVPLRHQVVQVPMIDLSSTELRHRIAEGRSIRYLVPRAVECYIQDKKLYQETP